MIQPRVNAIRGCGWRMWRIATFNEDTGDVCALLVGADARDGGKASWRLTRLWLRPGYDDWQLEDPDDELTITREEARCVLGRIAEVLDAKENG